MSRARDRGQPPGADRASRLRADENQQRKKADAQSSSRTDTSAAPKKRRAAWKAVSAQQVREASQIPPEMPDSAQPQTAQAAETCSAPPYAPQADQPDTEQMAEMAFPTAQDEMPRVTASDRPALHTAPTEKLHFAREKPVAPPEKTDANPAWSARAQTAAQAQTAEGQNVPKDSGGKFRQESHAEQINRAKFRMEKQAAKRDKTQGKLAKQKPPKKKGLVRKAAGAAGWSVHGYVHGKIYQNEHENVGIEGAHRTELAAEAAGRKLFRYGRRRLREHPAKAARRAESKFVKAAADYHFRKAAQEHPGLEKNVWKRFWKKHQLKKRYRGQFRKRAQQAAKYGGTAVKKTAAVTEKAAARAFAFLKRHPAAVLLVLACLLLMVLVQSCTAALAPMGSGMSGGVVATTYAARDEDIYAAEAAYCGMEDELQAYLDNYTATHSYDEYHFDLDEIGHDPYVLISILSALHEGEWTMAEVEDTLQDLFDRQYILTERVVAQTRNESDTWYVCYVTLENFDLSHLPVYLMNEQQMTRYALYMRTLGNRPDLFPDSVYAERYTRPGDRYEVPAEYMGDETFAALLREAEKYVGYPYVWGGSSPATSFDCSGYLCWVLNQCGWSVGRTSAQGLYNYCTPTSSPKPGDLVFFVGTYDTPEISHCGFYLGDGMMLHCGNPIGYANINTSYWQSHFYAFGRLP